MPLRDDDDDDDSGNGASNGEGSHCPSPTAAAVVARNEVVKSKPQPVQRYPMNRPMVPNVVLTGKLYEDRRKARMQKIEKIEREQRQFHAKRVPNFNSIHAAQSVKRANDEPKFTIPVTPKVVHHHRKNLERIRIKVSTHGQKEKS